MAESTTGVLEATDKAIKAATDEGLITDKDAGAVAAIRALAQKIDQMAVYMDALAARAEMVNGRPPTQDNVTIPTYLKYCDALKLTPGSRELKQRASSPAPRASEPEPAVEESPTPGLRSIGKRAS